MDNTEKGAAEIRIKLENSIITVCHFDGSFLFNKQAIAGDWSRLWVAIRKQSEPLTPQQLDKFLSPPGVNLTGICKEAGIAKQYLNRCRKDKVLPGKSIFDKLLPVLIRYGF